MKDETTMKIEVPEPPAVLPKDKQAEWKKNYAEAHAEAQENNEDTITQRQHAQREANRVLRTPKLASAADAQKLEPWQVLKRQVVKGEMHVVTIDGKKYKFAVGKGEPATDGKGSQNGAGAQGGEQKTA